MEVRMGRIDANMSGYLHTYEAYRIPKGTKVKDTTGKDVILSNEEDILVLTEKASRQLVEDRRNYGYMLQMQAERAAQRTQEEASEKYAKDQAKVMSVFRAMAKGDIVPASDEKKLMEYSSELYQSAKMAQSMALQAERRKHKSQWDDKEEEAHEAKMKELRDESNEAALAVGTGSSKFSNEQKERIVEIDSSGVDFSSMQVMNLGSGVAGAYIDLSV